MGKTNKQLIILLYHPFPSQSRKNDAAFLEIKKLAQQMQVFLLLLFETEHPKLYLVWREVKLKEKIRINRLKEKEIVATVGTSTTVVLIFGGRSRDSPPLSPSLISFTSVPKSTVQKKQKTDDVPRAMKMKSSFSFVGR